MTQAGGEPQLTVGALVAKAGAVRAGRPDEAAGYLRQAVALAPFLPTLHFDLGNVLAECGRVAEAAAAFRHAVALRPDYAEALANLGVALHRLGRLEEAADAHRQALALRPDIAEIPYNLGNTLQGLGRFAESVAAYLQALEARPAYPQAWSNLGNALRAVGKPQDAIIAYRQAIELLPAYPEAHSNLGLALQDLGETDAAIAAYRQAVAIDSGFAKAHHNLGNVLKDLGRVAEALDAYRRAFALDSGLAEALAAIVHLRQQICDWPALAAEEAALLEAVRRGARVAPMILNAIPAAGAADQLACARIWAEAFRVPPETVFAHASPQAAERPLRIGYLSADFHNHATAHLMAQVFERHDRGRVGVTGYSLGPDDGSAMRRRLAAAFDCFVDLRGLGHAEAALRIAEDGIDILVDLKGYSQNARTQILAWRPAPIQVNYLAYPGTMGADFIDYLIADRFVVPADRQPFFTERLVHLPDCYQPSDTSRAVAPPPPRAACGLPEAGIVFCCFNNPYKLTPDFFTIWMGLLAAVPGSVLWLLETNPLVAANLRKEAAARGIAADRLVFAAKLSPAEHLARHRCADLFLDTLPCNAHTTASDALWAGLPVVTCAGDTFAGRVAGSLLHALGLPDLVTASVEDYQRLALRLAREPGLLAEIRATLARNRATAPLFDGARLTANLERAYMRMWERRRAGGEPAPFSVE